MGGVIAAGRLGVAVLQRGAAPPALLPPGGEVAELVLHQSGCASCYVLKDLCPLGIGWHLVGTRWR